MSTFSDEMKAAADYTIKTAKEKFGQELDYSEQSILKLEGLLDQAYQSLSNLAGDERRNQSIIRTANIWGSYLGEYMRLKWGGTWVMKGSDRILSIKNIDFNPIGLVYQKITNHPEYSVSQYFSEVERKISLQPITPLQSQTASENASQPKAQIPVNRLQNTVTIDKRLIFAIAGIGGFIFILFACVVGFMIFNTGRAEFESKLNAFLVEAEKLNVMTEQGVNYQDFRNQLVEVKASYAAIDSWPSSYQDERRLFDLAIRGWELTLDIWDWEINSTFPEFEVFTEVENYIGEKLSWDDEDRIIGLLMAKAGSYFERGKAGVR